MVTNSSCDHIQVWRRAVFLFKQPRTNIKGPCLEAGFSKILIEHSIGTTIGESPDIISWNPDIENPYYLICDITCRPDLNDGKVKQIEKYKQIQPESLYNIGIQSDKKPIVLLLTKNEMPGLINCPQIVLTDKLSCLNLEQIEYEPLRGCLKNNVGVDLIHIPEISFTLVPEIHYVRPCIIDSIMHMFSPKIAWFTAEDIAKDAMDIIYEEIDSKMKINVIKNIDEQLSELSKKHLGRYIFHEGDKYIITNDGKKVCTSASTRSAIEKTLKHWAGIKTTLDSFEPFQKEKADSSV